MPLNMVSAEVLGQHLDCPTSYSTALPQNVRVSLALEPSQTEELEVQMTGVYKDVSFYGTKLLKPLLRPAN